MKRRNWIGFIPIISIASATWLTVFATLWCSNSGPVIPVKGPWDLEDYTYGDEDTCKAWLYYDGQGRDILDVPDHQFENNTELELVSTNGSEANLNRIGEYAFANCTNLQRVDFGPNLIKVHKGAFNGCPNLKCIDLSMLDSAKFTNLMGWFSIMASGGQKIADSLPTVISGPYEGLLLREGTKLTVTQANVLKAVGFPTSWVNNAIEVHDFMTDTWANIAEQAASGIDYLTAYYGFEDQYDFIGKERSIEIAEDIDRGVAGGTYIVRVVDVDHFYLDGTTNKLALTFQFTTTIGRAISWDSYDSTFEYIGSDLDMYLTMNETANDGIYIDIEQAIGVELPWALVCPNEEVGGCKLFAPSACEYTSRFDEDKPIPFFQNNNIQPIDIEESTQFEYYRRIEAEDIAEGPNVAKKLRAAATVKTFGGEKTYSWLRTVDLTSTYVACLMNSGSGTFKDASWILENPQPCAPCFCL